MKAKIIWLIVFSILAITVVSCDDFHEREPYFPYLDVHTIERESFTSSDWISIRDAAYRMQFYVDNGVLKASIENAEAINVSPRLFSILLQIINFANQQNIFSGQPNTRSQDPPTPYDCVARSLAAWGGYSYSEIEGWIIQNYGTGGVPTQKIGAVFHRFYPDAIGVSPNYLDSTSISSITFSDATTIGIFASNSGIPGMGHMVNISGYSNDTLEIFDYQDSTTHQIPFSNLLFLYFRPTAVDTCATDIAIEAFRLAK